MNDARWFAGSYDQTPILVWQSSERLWLLPERRALVVDLTGESVPRDSDRVDGVVSNLLDLGLHLVTRVDMEEAPAFSPGWVLRASPQMITLTGPDGILALEAEPLEGSIDLWNGMVRRAKGAVLFSGSNIIDSDGIVDLESACSQGTLVTGWASLVQ